MKKLFILFFILLSLCCIPACTVSNEASTCNINFFETTISGTYSGEMSNSTPHGDGTLTTEDNIVFTGKWKNGCPAGPFSIIFPDDKTFSVTYKNGFINGKVTETFTDKTTTIYTVKNGIPYGEIKHYSKDQELQDVDWFFHGTPIKTLIANASAPSYSELLNNNYSDLAHPLVIKGKIESIYNNNKNCYLKVRDKNDQLYICFYKNNTYHSNQAMVPMFLEGDSVVLYGLFQKSSSLSSLDDSTLGTTSLSYDKEFSINNLFETSTELSDNSSSDNAIFQNDSSLYSTMPFIYLFYGEYKDLSSYEIDKEPSDYETLCKYTYFYNQKDVTITGEVVYQSVNYDNNRVILIVQNPKDGAIYYCYYSLNNSLVIPSVNDTIDITGSIRGNRKLKTSYQSNCINYLICPLIKVKELQK